jgi:hypothetical protein
MVGGVVLVIICLVAVIVAFYVVIRSLMQAFNEWWSKPVEPALQLPLPSVTGPECLVLAFADMFIEPVQSPPEHLKAYFSLVPSSGVHVPNKQLVEEMFFASFVWLSCEGAIEWSVRKRNVDPFSPFPPRDWELHMRPVRAFPRTPFARNLEVGFRRALKAWFIHKPGDQTAPVEEVIEFALREIRRLTGWTKLTGDAYRDFIQYVQHFLAERGLYEVSEEKGLFGRRRIMFKPIKERIDELRAQAEQLKAQLMQFVDQEPILTKQLRTSISEGLAAIKQIEPDRNAIF